MGIAGATALTLAVFSSLKIYYKVALIALVAIMFSNISVSSQQGYLNFIAGFIAAVIFRAKGNPVAHPVGHGAVPDLKLKLPDAHVSKL